MLGTQRARGGRLTQAELIEEFLFGAESGEASALSIRGDNLYSYAEPIAERVWVDDHHEFRVKERSDYGSVTSNRHCNMARRVLGGAKV